MAVIDRPRQRTALTTYAITEKDDAGPSIEKKCKTTIEEKANLKHLGYSSVAEMLAETGLN